MEKLRKQVVQWRSWSNWGLLCLVVGACSAIFMPSFESTMACYLGGVLIHGIILWRWHVLSLRLRKLENEEATRICKEELLFRLTGKR